MGGGWGWKIVYKRQLKLSLKFNVFFVLEEG